MNNDQFRKLLLANSAEPSSSKNGAPPTTSPSGGGALGSRQRASIPMTPRAVAGAQGSFARQLAERNQAAHPQKKYKTSAPKGVRLASGYVDRAQQRQDDAADDREQRLKALELLLRKEEIDRETYDKLRFEIAGGSLDSTHLVKGLDFKLLERVRRGEDVYGNKGKEPAEDDEAGDDSKGDDNKGDDAPDGDDNDDDNVDDVDGAFDEFEGREVQTLEKEKTGKKKGQLSTVSLAPGRKRTRDQILAELKAAREAAKAEKTSSLGSRFKKIGTTQKPGTRIERDSKGREVLIIVDEDGHEKRKVRKLRPGEEEDKDKDILMPNPDAKPLGMDVPEQYKQQEVPEQDEDVDIFDGVGDDYDPLAGLDASESDSDDEKAKAEKGDAEPSAEGAEKPWRTGATDAELMPPPPRPAAAGAPRNYFKDSKTGLLSMEEAKGPSMSDPDIMAAIKRAAALRPVESEEDGKAKEEARAMEERRQKLLRMSDRDDEDIDMGFGTSRFEDEEDFDESKVKLSTWGGDDDGGEGRDKGGQGKRKRGPKKRKGDANNADDVLRVMEQRKKS